MIIISAHCWIVHRVYRRHNAAPRQWLLLAFWELNPLSEFGVGSAMEDAVPFAKDGTDDTGRFALVQFVYIGCDRLQRIAGDYSGLKFSLITGKMYYTSYYSSQTFRTI